MFTVFPVHTTISFLFWTCTLSSASVFSITGMKYPTFTFFTNYWMFCYVSRMEQTELQEENDSLENWYFD